MGEANRKRAYASARERGCQFGEAFMLMWYACKCSHRERIWNSRDGVTPFGLRCPSCSDIMHHVDWHLDAFAPTHRPQKYQRFFRDGTADEAEAIMRRRIARGVEQGAPMTPEYEAQLLEHARSDSAGSEFQKGWPTVDIQKEVAND